MTDEKKGIVCPYSGRCTMTYGGRVAEDPITKSIEGIYNCKHVIEEEFSGCYVIEQLNLLERIANPRIIDTNSTD